eukprot:Lankesteria_metandrocarpae@DN442_c0_g1_i1.p1
MMRRTFESNFATFRASFTTFFSAANSFLTAVWIFFSSAMASSSLPNLPSNIECSSCFSSASSSCGTFIDCSVIHHEKTCLHSIKLLPMLSNISMQVVLESVFVFSCQPLRLILNKAW